jgi:hypothetical protein
MVHKEHDHDKTSDPNRQTADIQDRNQQVLPNVTERNLQIVFDHGSSVFSLHLFQLMCHHLLSLYFQYFIFCYTRPQLLISARF